MPSVYAMAGKLYRFWSLGFVPTHALRYCTVIELEGDLYKPQQVLGRHWSAISDFFILLVTVLAITTMRPLLTVSSLLETNPLI